MMLQQDKQDEGNKGITFKNCALFTNCKSETNNTGIDNAKDSNVNIYFDRM